jgi:aryl-alcohol dehydrogenase-like predicted oxidoreductase
MQETRLGRAGLRVSRIGLGLAALGRPGYINLGHAADLEHDYAVAAMRDRTWDVLDRAWAAGVRYVDAARSYGRAEEFLAAWLEARNVAPGTVAVGSKWGYVYTAGWRVDAAQHEVKEHSIGNFTRQLAETQAHLGAHLALYQIHSATLESGVLADGAVLDALARLRATGVAIGLSTSGPHQADIVRQALAIHAAGQPLFTVVQATWNLLERSAAPALAEAHAAGVGVIVKEAVANGRLTARNTDPAFAAGRRLLDGAARRASCTIDALAIAGALAQPWADVVLSGAASVAQLESNLAALAVPWDARVDTALGPIAESPAVYWERRARLAWN